ncbi:glycosyltransferase family 2 protein, partial [Bacteroides congonensis]
MMQTLLIDKMISVSIIIPVYNVEQYIESCLLSVINQNYKGDIECVIVNDCTPDQSMVVVHKILSDYDGNILFKIVDHKENRGLSASRNSGVRVATGDYLYFLDSDDILAKNAIALLADLALKDLPDVVMGDFELIGSNQNIPQLKTTITHFNIQKDIFNAFISYELYEMAWNKLVKRQFFYR